MINKKLLTAQELAKALGLSIETIRRYTREKQIPYVELASGQYRYLVEDVISALYTGADGQVYEEQADYAVCRKLTYEDYAKLPNEVGYTLQLIDGMIIREPGPTFLHQRISRRLEFILLVYFEKVDPQGEIFDAPIDLSLGKHTVLQPDLLYLPGSRPALRNPLDSLPELIVEISSPSTARTDRVIKMNSYLKAGVPHYWIVNPLGHCIECYQLQDDRYHPIPTMYEGTFKHPAFPGLTFEIEELFAEPEMPEEEQKV